MATVLDDLGFSDAVRIGAIAERWEQIAGPAVAAHVRPVALRGATLELRADSSVWCQQLALCRRELLGALHTELGDAAPRELWIGLG